MDRRMSILKRIMSKIEVSTSLFFHGVPCWLWLGRTSGNGRGGDYPRMELNGATVAVHLVMYTHFFGYIPWNRQVDHECGNRRCVNPHHLSLVSQLENQRRRDGKRPRTGTEYGIPIPPRYESELQSVREELCGHTTTNTYRHSPKFPAPERRRENGGGKKQPRKTRQLTPSTMTAQSGSSSLTAARKRKLPSRLN